MNNTEKLREIINNSKLEEADKKRLSDMIQEPVTKEVAEAIRGELAVMAVETSTAFFDAYVAQASEDLKTDMAAIEAEGEKMAHSIQDDMDADQMEDVKGSIQTAKKDE